MVNGALLLNREFDLKRHLSKMIHIFLVFCCWKFLMVFLCEIFFHEPLCPWTIPEFLNYMAGYQTSYHPTEAFWFFPALLQIYLMLPIVKKIYDLEKKEYIKYVCALLFCVSFLPRTLDQIFEIAGLQILDVTIVDFYNPFGTYSNHLLYFILGGLLHKKYYVEKEKDGAIVKTCILAILINGGLLWMIKGCSTGFTGERYNGIPGYSMIPTLFLSCAIFLLFLRSDHSKERGTKCKQLITAVADHTLSIYILHLLLGRIAVSLWYGKILYRNVVINGLKCVVLITASFLVGKIMRKIPVVDKLTKI
ncbi:MAG: acyltransferase [Lachnospiraceae bacterium]|nr:acyltransferase [Lachnospiraceae bacterium]